MFKYLTLIILTIILFFSPVSAGLVQFWPDADSVSTTDIRDIIDGTNERVIFATTNGISIYDGENWEILHALPKDRRGYLEGIPLDDYVLEIEYDYLNNLWLGYSNGLQIYNGYSKPFTIRQPDGILFDVSINKLKRQGKIMWIATGDSGIFYYLDGSFTWVRPGEETGLTGNHINDIEVDYSKDRLYVASVSDGQFTFKGNPENITFKKISDPLITEDMIRIVSYPKGGVLFFNKTDVVHYSGVKGSSHVFSIGDLSPDADKILDVAVTKDGRYVIGTDFGIFCWNKGEVCKHITRYEGLSGNDISTVFIDDKGRWWFASKDTVGYYVEPEFVAISSIELKPSTSATGPTILGDLAYLI